MDISFGQFRRAWTAAVVALALAPSAHAQDLPPAPPASISLTPTEMFALAQQREQAGDHRQARALLTALTHHPDPEYRSEARFRLAKLLMAQGEVAEATTLLEALIEERPTAAPALLLLGQAQAMQGRFGAARHALDDARTAGLPDEIEAVVDRYRAALRSLRPYGITLDLGFAADSNINHATSSDVLGTVIGDFTLDEDAKETSGTGIRSGLAAFARVPVAADMSLLVRANGDGRFYGKSRFNDVAAGAIAGPEWNWGTTRLQLSGAAGWRWFGGAPLSREWGADARVSAKVGAVGILSLQPAWRRINDLQSDLRDGDRYTVGVALDRRIGKRVAARVSLRGGRLDARSSAYSDTSFGAGLLATLDTTPATLLATIDASRLDADERVFLYPEPRRDRTWRGSFGAVLKPLEVQGFAPRIEISRTHASSNIEIYDYRRTAVELGVQRIF